MAYISTVDERYGGGFLQYDADDLDAPSTLNSTYVLAENDVGYGNLSDMYISADRDVYSLGILSTGYYTVDVDEYRWDLSEFGFGSVSEFRVLDSFGFVVDRSFSTYSDITFVVTSPETYYVEIIGGSSFSEEQYSVVYDKVGELNTAPEIESTPPLVALEDTTYSYSLIVSDVDGDDIYFDDLSSVLPSWLTRSGNVISGRPTQSDVGLHDVKIVIEDEFGAVDVQVFTIAVANLNDPPTGSIKILGDPTLRVELSADVSSVFDQDGVDGSTIRFQWMRDGKNILGATDIDYTLVVADVGSAISVAVSYTDLFGAKEKLVSTQTSPVNGDLLIKGGSGDDILKGEKFNDTILGRGGSDELYGFAGIDKLVGGAGGDKLRGGGAQDTLKGNGGADRLLGQQGNDTLAGGGGGDTLLGGGGADNLLGQKGNDVLIGGKGRDTLSGNGGSDKFVFARADGIDTITDFNPNRETIVITSGANNFGGLSFKQVGTDAHVSFANTVIKVQNTNVSDLTADVFDFA